MWVRVPPSAQIKRKACKNNNLHAFAVKTGTESEQNNIFSLDAFNESTKKKMQLNLQQGGLDVKYYPAILKTLPSGWRIEFYSLNPYSQILERVCYKVNKLRRKYNCDRIAKRELNKHCEIINYKLLTGWSPFVDASIREIITLSEVCEKYLSIKSKELREESLRSYRSYIHIFIEWLIIVKKDKLIPNDFTKADAMRYLDWITVSKNVSANTWNNYRNFMITLFQWLIERSYHSKNYFAEISLKKGEKKKRIIIPANERQRIFDYLTINDKPFLMFLLFEFNCLLRPIEIFRMKIGDINIDNQLISLVGSQTKNKKNRNISIPNEFIGIIKKYWNEFNIANCNKDNYLFSSMFRTGTNLMRTKDAGTKWINLRKELNLKDEYQMYSLRDTAITEMLINNISSKTVQAHADHSSLAITSKYADHITPEMREDIKIHFPEF